MADGKRCDRCYYWVSTEFKGMTGGNRGIWWGVCYHPSRGHPLNEQRTTQSPACDYFRSLASRSTTTPQRACNGTD